MKEKTGNVTEDEGDGVQQRDVLITERSALDMKEKTILEAKKDELNKWVEENVYEEVYYDGQKCLSTTWVVTDKMNKNVSVTKARLVIRGYEEEEENRSDSPTCSKSNICMLLAIAVAKNWKINALDVKVAFLQGKQIEREV